MQEYSQENFGLTTMAKTQLLYPKNGVTVSGNEFHIKRLFCTLDIGKNSNPEERFGANS